MSHGRALVAKGWFLAVGAACLLAASPAAAETSALEAKRGELSRIEEAITLADTTIQRIEQEVAAIGADRIKVRSDRLATARRIRETEQRILDARARLSTLAGNEEAIRDSLAERHDVLVEVIATVQRMGRRPPPAVLVRPDDALAAVRSAMLLGSLLPDMRDKVRALAADLEELKRVRVEITDEQETLRAALTSLAEDDRRLDLLARETERRESDRSAALASEQARARALAQDARSLRELVARLAREADATRQATENEGKTAEARPSFAALNDPARMAPGVPFSELAGRVELPVTGVVLRRFGEDDGSGLAEAGVVVAARAGALVTAPADGWIVYAGPFRTFGNVLIMNVGEGYHVVMTGMERISVDLGQFVLAGEPVAVMGDDRARQGSAGAASPASPTLFIEFRKDGTTIDPAPWLVTSNEKARG